MRNQLRNRARKLSALLALAAMLSFGMVLAAAPSAGACFDYCPPGATTKVTCSYGCTKYYKVTNSPYNLWISGGFYG